MFPTGTDIQVFLADAPEGRTWRFKEEDALDVSMMSIIEEGQITPLYDFARSLPVHLAYSTRMVEGSLHFNVSQHFHRTRRKGRSYQHRSTLSSLHGERLFVVMKYTQHTPTPQLIREVYRLDDVWEHPFQHQIQSVAQETMPFTAREMVLVGRQRRPFNMQEVSRWVSEGGAQQILGEDRFEPEFFEEPATILRVTDADTYVIKPGPNSQITTGSDGTRNVRLVAAQAPETPKETLSVYSRNRPNDWRWPSGETPTEEQLDGWGTHAAQQTFELLGGSGSYSESDNLGTRVMLMRSPAAAPSGSPATGGDLPRIHAQVHYGSYDLARWLIDQGLARVYSDANSITYENGQWRSRIAELEQLFKKRRSAAGGDSAVGIWKSFEAPS